MKRDLPGVGGMNRAQFKDVATTSNNALAKLAGNAQWEHSYIVDNKSFCIYLAEDEAAVKEHAKLSGFPATKVTEVRTVIDPMTANS
jgi:Nickel responsive protein SCO4226-like